METNSNAQKPDPDCKKQLQAIREHIDAIDAQLLSLFRRRMEAVEQVALLKKEHNLPISDPTRERQILDKLPTGSGNGCEAEVAQLMRTVITLSKTYQHRRLHRSEPPLLPPPR